MRAKGVGLFTGMLLTLVAGISHADNFSPFTVDSFEQIRGSYQGEPFLVSLWSISCLPCRVELEMLGELKQADPDFPLVLISTDPIEMREESLYILEEHGLETIPSWMFADGFVERLRYTVDPGWYGELPRSYLYAEDHSFKAHSGVLTKQMLDEFVVGLD